MKVSIELSLNIANHMPSYMQIKSLPASSIPLIYSVQMKAQLQLYKTKMILSFYNQKKYTW